MAAAPLAFYFDFISPYGYFASRHIDALAARHGRGVDWRPMLLGVAVLKVMGLKPLLDTPLKGDYVRRDVRRHARREGIALRDPDQPVSHPLAMGRAFCWVKQHHPDSQGAVAHAIYDAYWARGLDLSTPQSLAQVALPPGLPADVLVRGAESQEGADLLRASVAAATGSGIFGSPTVVADGEPFWGVDRLPEVDDWLRRGGW